MSKQYGLILPGQQKKPGTAPATLSGVRPTIFDESSSDSSDNGPPQLKPLSNSLSSGPSMVERRMARSIQEKALAEDPTIFQYDEVYDDMETKREDEKQTKRAEPRKPKYIGRLMEHAERRKLENELRIERQVQKEREAEGESFKDKETYVTAAYRKKLEEIRKMQEQDKRDEYLETIGDVTKQKDLDGFYRHLYEQKTRSEKTVIKPNLPKTNDGEAADVGYAPIKSVGKQRAYRKRHSSDEDIEHSEASTLANAKDNEAKKAHLANNIDADSDFSIDSDTSGDEENESNAQKNEQLAIKQKSHTADDNNKIAQLNSATIALQLPSATNKELPSSAEALNDKLLPLVKEAEEGEEENKPVKPKVDKTLIWQKRTVGPVFDAAVQRYYERKAARNA